MAIVLPRSSGDSQYSVLLPPSAITAGFSPAGMSPGVTMIFLSTQGLT